MALLPSLQVRVAGLVGMVLLPPLAILLLILTRGVNVPFLDDWALVPFALKAHAGDVSLADLWAQHNEHRIAAVRLVILLLLPVTRFDVVDLLFAAYAVALLSLVLFWRALRLTAVASDARSTLIALLPVSFLLFSAVQYESWLYMLSALQWQLVVLCGAMTAWCLAKWPESGKALAVSAGCSVVSTLTLAGGIALWPAAVVGAILSSRSRSWTATTLWIGVGVMTLVAVGYFIGYAIPDTRSSSFRVLTQPAALVAFALAYLGSPLSLRLEVAMFWGGVGLAVSTAAVWSALRRPDIPRGSVAPWIALWLYALGFALILALGRAELGPGAALARRYPTAAALLWIATIPLLGWVVRTANGAPRRQSRAVALVVKLAVWTAATSYVGTNLFAMFEVESLYRRLVVARQELEAPGALPSEDTARFLFPPNPAIPRDYSEQLRDAGLWP